MSPCPYPHPAFLPALLPDNIQTQLQRTSKPHYPAEYLEKLKPLDSPANKPVEKVAKGLVSVVLALSLIAARTDFLWIGNSELLNRFAGQKHRKQTVWLRRILLLEGLAECHGMASGLLHHSESVLYNQTSAPPHRMVYALIGEFNSHRTHLLTFLSIAKPVFLTRLILLSTQIVGYFAQGLLCLIYMPLCFQLARYTSEAASRVYADLTKDIDAGEVPDIAHAPVPAVSTVFYNLPENATMRLVCQCIKADDVFHACWEDSACKDHHNATGRMYKMSNGLMH
ncbi:hypothetical protein ABBQ32_000110 [Trebouxia sp. C0010 RCD-2024]